MLQGRARGGADGIMKFADRVDERRPRPFLSFSFRGSLPKVRVVAVDFAAAAFEGGLPCEDASAFEELIAGDAELRLASAV